MNKTSTILTLALAASLPAAAWYCPQNGLENALGTAEGAASPTNTDHWGMTALGAAVAEIPYALAFKTNSADFVLDDAGMMPLISSSFVRAADIAVSNAYRKAVALGHWRSPGKVFTNESTYVRMLGLTTVDPIAGGSEWHGTVAYAPFAPTNTFTGQTAQDAVELAGGDYYPYCHLTVEDNYVSRIGESVSNAYAVLYSTNVLAVGSGYGEFTLSALSANVSSNAMATMRSSGYRALSQQSFPGMVATSQVFPQLATFYEAMSNSCVVATTRKRHWWHRTQWDVSVATNATTVTWTIAYNSHSETSGVTTTAAPLRYGEKYRAVLRDGGTGLNFITVPRYWSVGFKPSNFWRETLDGTTYIAMWGSWTPCCAPGFGAYTNVHHDITYDTTRTSISIANVPTNGYPWKVERNGDERAWLLARMTAQTNETVEGVALSVTNIARVLEQSGHPNGGLHAAIRSKAQTFFADEAVVGIEDALNDGRIETRPVYKTDTITAQFTILYADEEYTRTNSPAHYHKAFLFANDPSYDPSSGYLPTGGCIGQLDYDTREYLIYTSTRDIDRWNWVDTCLLPALMEDRDTRSVDYHTDDEPFVFAVDITLLGFGRWQFSRWLRDAE